jgi:hypothetical protein
VFGLAATIAGQALFAEYVGDYLAAVSLGVVFQYFAIAPMRGLCFRKGIIAAAKADVLSLTALEVGLFGWMALMTDVLFPHPHPHLQSCLLVLDADRHDYWVCHRVARERVAGPPRGPRKPCDCAPYRPGPTTGLLDTFARGKLALTKVRRHGKNMRLIASIESSKNVIGIGCRFSQAG